MDWNAPYLDHKIWILDHLEQLHCEPKEALVLLLIDLYNDLRQPIHHEEIAQKLGIDTDEVESLFLSLADKGYLRIAYQEGIIKFDIEFTKILGGTFCADYQYGLSVRGMFNNGVGAFFGFGAEIAVAMAAHDNIHPVHAAPQFPVVI